MVAFTSGSCARNFIQLPSPPAFSTSAVLPKCNNKLLHWTVQLHKQHYLFQLCYSALQSSMCSSAHKSSMQLNTVAVNVLFCEAMAHVSEALDPSDLQFVVRRLNLCCKVHLLKRRMLHFFYLYWIPSSTRRRILLLVAIASLFGNL